MPRPPSSPSPSPSPPPAFFPFTAGSFDFPHASASEQTSPRARHEPAAARHSRRRSPRPSRRGPMHRLFGPPRDSEPIDNLARRPPTANPNRPRATPSERYLRRSQARIREHRASMESAADLLDTLSDIPITNPFTTASVRPRSPTIEHQNDRRQTKRRKLDHKPGSTSEYDGFKYGYKGQVVAGRLKMQIVSCDGGEYSERDNPSLYTVQNVLKNDKSVYCSESSRCNLLLKHIGDTPFTLEKIVIRAPDRGFTAPIQEGLIFVSMSPSELLSNTSAYNLQYTSRSPPPMSPAFSDASNNEQMSLEEAIEGPYIWQHSRLGTEEQMRERVRARVENLRLRTARLNRESSLRSERDWRRGQRQYVDNDNDEYSEHCDRVGEDSFAGIRRVSAPTPPPFTVTTASEEEASDSNEDLPSAAVMADRLRRESRWRLESDDETETSLPRFGGLRRAPALDVSTHTGWRERRERYVEPLRASQVGAPSHIAPTGDSSTLIPPHARFFIAKNKSKITIKFHPAISGKNVLLKLWSPTHDGNIDIESVQFYGYSGPRYFPAMQPC